MSRPQHPDGNKYCAASNQDQLENKVNEVIEVHSKALDDVVNVNSLFTMAVFIGLSFASSNQHSLENRPICDPDPDMPKRLILYEVLSFGFFLISSLAAKSLKVLLNFHKIKNQLKLDIKPLLLFLTLRWRYTLLFVSFAASIGGIIALTLSMTHLIQIRLGKIYCGSVYATGSTTSLIAMVCISLVTLYIPPFLIALSADVKEEDNEERRQDSGSNGV
ncbi:Maternal effect embryo arrest 60 [Melia azedarach]|uniref:Maternal effect embryo arrest 60 n=1 Tax=Melia azedarach TaxID=155640 RepID=A0ACC1XZW4_MELAZ|nr:Maternal effect embryo arrest 60 [Melia azedarach]